MKNYEIKEFDLNGKIIKIKFIKNPKRSFIAQASNFGVFGLGYISVDKLFFNFSKNEQKSMIYHELWHYKNNLKFEIEILFSKKFWIFLSQNKLSKLQELEADKYASIKNNKKNMIRTLKYIKILCKKGEVEYNYKNHPTLEERIKKIKELK